MNKEQQEKYNRGRRLIKELEEITSRYQKLRFYIDTTEDIESSTKYILEAQSSTMEEYMRILTKRLEHSIY